MLPLDAGSLTTVDDPWVLASQAFAPCYIGGWTAAEHWGLTEQIFRSTFVVTAGAARTTSLTLMGSEFRIVRATKERVATVQPTWRGSVRVAVTDRERTLADGLANPDWVGGVRHLIEMLSTYRRSENWEPTKLLSALAAHPKGAAYKRLGYLAETVLGGNDALIKAAFDHRSSGVIRLDPQVKKGGKILTRWGLRLNVSLPVQDAS
ncbi:MAG: type IV toxin-antitoxin system AbiEi family antitoxin [Myxococcaceae bacterium]